MAILAHLLFFSLLLSGCGLTTITDIRILETDTYISSLDPIDHSSDKEILLYKDSTLEERIIVKIPTGEKEDEEYLDDVLANPLNFALFPFIIFASVLKDLFDCQTNVLQPENLTDSRLVFNVVQDGEGSLGGKIGLNSLTKPWWHNANWTAAHFFSFRGLWDSPGGDIDSTFTELDSVVSGSTIEFGITTYFKSLITSGQEVHYGLVLKSKQATLGRVRLASTQHGTVSERPRVVSTYTGSCTNTSRSKTNVYVLGNDDLSREFNLKHSTMQLN